LPPPPPPPLPSLLPEPPPPPPPEHHPQLNQNRLSKKTGRIRKPSKWDQTPPSHQHPHLPLPGGIPSSSFPYRSSLASVYAQSHSQSHSYPDRNQWQEENPNVVSTLPPSTSTLVSDDIPHKEPNSGAQNNNNETPTTSTFGYYHAISGHNDDNLTTIKIATEKGTLDPMKLPKNMEPKEGFDNYNNMDEEDVDEDDANSVQMEISSESGSSEFQPNASETTPPKQQMMKFTHDDSPEAAPTPFFVSFISSNDSNHHEVNTTEAPQSESTHGKDILPSDLSSPRKEEESDILPNTTTTTTKKSPFPSSPSSVHQDVIEWSSKSLSPTTMTKTTVSISDHDHIHKQVMSVNVDSVWVPPEEMAQHGNPKQKIHERMAMKRKFEETTSPELFNKSRSKRQQHYHLHPYDSDEEYDNEYPGKQQQQPHRKNNHKITRVKTSRWGKMVRGVYSTIDINTTKLMRLDQQENEDHTFPDRLRLEEASSSREEEIGMVPPGSSGTTEHTSNAVPQNTPSIFFSNVSDELAEKRARVLQSIKPAAAKRLKEAAEAEAKQKLLKTKKSLELVNKSQSSGGNDTSNSSPTRKIQLTDITALSQRIFISNISQSGPANRVRIQTESTYQPQYKERKSNSIKINTTTETTQTKKDQVVPLPILDIEENKRQSDALRDKLARLKQRLAAKVLQNKQKRMKQKLLDNSLRTFSCSSNQEEAPNESSSEISKQQPSSTIANIKITKLGSQSNVDAEKESEQVDKEFLKLDTSSQATSVNSSEKEKSLSLTQPEPNDTEQTNEPPQPSEAYIDGLRRRQRELRNEIDLSKMKNIRTQQQELLATHTGRMQKNAALLKSCTQEIEQEEKIISMKETHLKTLEKKKLIMENMLAKVTRRLMESRKRLHESKRKRATYQDISAEAHLRSNSARRGRASDFF